MEGRITGVGVGLLSASPPHTDIPPAVYVCQHPQPKRCDLFLWDDEAKAREAACVLNNSRAELYEEPTTPRKPSPQYGLPTPQTEKHINDSFADDVKTPYTPSKSPARLERIDKAKASTNKDESQITADISGNEEFYDWPLSAGEDVKKHLDQGSYGNAHAYPETPRKSIKTDPVASPGKRSYADDASPPRYNLPTPTSNRKGVHDVFTTPPTTKKGNLFTDPLETPSTVRYPEISSRDSDLANEILSTLKTALSGPLFAEAQAEIKAVCHKHTMQTKGIMRGRDISRDMVKKKEARITELQNELEELKRERATDRDVIRQLRRDFSAQRRFS